jgi:hypothetical protein
MPDLFNSWKVWAAKETPYAVLRVAIIAETVTLIFRVLPRARARAQMLILIAVAVIGVALSRPYDTHTSYRLARDIATRMSYITIWSLIAILGLVAWYRVPLLRFHKAILHGLLWLLIAQFATVIGTARLGSHLMGNVYNLAQIPVISLWIVAALTEDTKGLGKDETAVIRYLQPWRKP